MAVKGKVRGVQLPVVVLPVAGGGGLMFRPASVGDEVGGGVGGEGLGGEGEGGGDADRA
jgi:hypothetical protein